MKACNNCSQGPVVCLSRSRTPDLNPICQDHGRARVLGVLGVSPNTPPPSQN